MDAIRDNPQKVRYLSHPRYQEDFPYSSYQELD